MTDIQEKEAEKFWLALRKNTMWRDSTSGIVERHINELLATAIETAIKERDAHWKTLRAKELRELGAKMEAKYAEGTHPVMDTALALLNELIEKPTK